MAKAQPSGHHLPALLLRIGLAVVFLYAAVSSLRHPLDWTGYVPTFATRFVAITTFVKLMAIYELVLSALLLVGKYRRYVGLLCAVTLAGIVLVNLGQLITTFRDIGLLFAALALAASDD